MSNQPQPTSNLIAPDSLKKSNNSTCSSVVRFSEDLEPDEHINNAEDIKMNQEDNFYQKENKTLNVNVLAAESEEMNNEINFDSEKFPKSETKLRPRGTIENNLGHCLPASVVSNSSKRLKNEENHEDHEGQMVNDESIKRIRLDSSDKEKNIQHGVILDQFNAHFFHRNLPAEISTYVKGYVNRILKK